MSKAKLTDRHSILVHDEDISNYVRQIEKYRQLCLENSRQRREQELVSLA